MTLCACSNKKILVINGVEDYLQIVLGQGEDLIWSWQVKTCQQGMLFLAPHLKYLFSTLSITPEELEGIVLVRGPGSFTGLRLVFAHVYGLALSHNIPVGALEYLPLLAKSVPFNKPIWVLTYSRQNEVYMQGFGASKMPLTSPEVLSVQMAFARLDSLKKQDFYLIGSALRKIKDDKLKAFQVLDDLYDKPLPEILLKEAQIIQLDTKFPQPLYLRNSNAEDNLPYIVKQKGLSLDQAKKKIKSGLKIRTQFN
ncbi:MAG: tRNA (adenosine(37)-N6)-threonylcarbamoyltransferase complex dimerization subunit type 1 TsaB [Desulfonauticus sp.]|nr:tRNA (adenosine(37)-N6)-threonylcarbamoyltransferase complex dimerization subunit type 1 TsaB [Desulfonauticus sp.]